MKDNCEILAPIANREMLEAAIHNGADAVYVGMAGYNARGRTPQESWDTLKDHIEYAHVYGVRVYVAFNVLIFEEELDDVIDQLYRLLALTPDAIIVQDVGLARLIKQICPEQQVHASTQMTITCAEAIRMTEDLGLSRYILARELSLEQVAIIRRATDKELEVFVHGALCIAYSGQCLTSESFWGRSGNRGQCAQSCRFEFSLVVDGEVKDLGVEKYLVSPRDLCALPQIKELQNIGIGKFKIEGRYKSSEYVALTTRLYQEASRHLAEAKSSDVADFGDPVFAGILSGVVSGH